MKKIIETKRHSLTIITNLDGLHIEWEHPQRKRLRDNEDFLMALAPLSVAFVGLGMFAIMVFGG